MKGFSDEKRDLLREELLDTARKRFARYGLDKTTIADLTGPVDIAPSTFCQFFDSKDECYLAVLDRETERFYGRAVAPLEETDDPERAIQEFLRITFEELETNPLIEQLFTGDDHERLTRLYSDEELAEQVDRELGYLVPYVEAWQAEGKIRESDTEAIAGTIEAAATLAPHREEIGEDRYPAIREVMIETIAAELTTTDRGDPHEGAHD